ncbi:ribonuclease P protein subunit p29 [Anopheles cruzii]|uniref:ribonuclease P protein subunit p29 n=1 Tax=Anopheles cruzii TaxID=68878 RepID=UPI0022EC5C79|nr:ribonuclease P protein subunit p29 [Anopheles cruzii]
MSATSSFVASFVRPEIRPESYSSTKAFESLHLVRQPKKKVPKPQTKQKRRLSRRDIKELGLYAIPHDTVQYKDAVPLHELWCGYISRFLQHRTPEVTDSQYNPLVASLLKADYHGAKITVVRSKQSSVVGLKGIVVLDTKGTFKIVSKDNRVRTIPKNDSVFEVHSKDKTITVFGKYLNARPAERSVRKVKVFSIPDL